MSCDDLPDDEFPDEDAHWSDEWEPDETTIPCPHCQESIYDDVDYCPKCGMGIVTDTSPFAGKSSATQLLYAAIVVGLIVALVLAAFWR